MLWTLWRRQLKHFINQNPRYDNKKCMMSTKKTNESRVANSNLFTETISCSGATSPTVLRKVWAILQIRKTTRLMLGTLYTVHSENSFHFIYFQLFCFFCQLSIHRPYRVVLLGHIGFSHIMSEAGVSYLH